MKQYYIFITALFAIIIVSCGFLYIERHNNQPIPEVQSENPTTTASTLEISENKAEVPPNSTYYYPISNYSTRITKRAYGIKAATSDSKDFVCGGAFSGYHNGDDLEVTENEINQDVPIIAITNGTVRQVSRVNGYGGLLIIEHNLDGQTVTANYGHINLEKNTLKQGDTITAGQQVGVLGNNCSTQTDGERKHLHFAIHKGTSIDVKGYVSSQDQLENWLSPKETLEKLEAK